MKVDVSKLLDWLGAASKQGTAALNEALINTTRNAKRAMEGSTGWHDQPDTQEAAQLLRIQERLQILQGLVQQVTSMAREQAQRGEVEEPTCYLCVATRQPKVGEIEQPRPGKQARPGCGPICDGIARAYEVMREDVLRKRLIIQGLRAGIANAIGELGQASGTNDLRHALKAIHASDDKAVEYGNRHEDKRA